MSQIICKLCLFKSEPIDEILIGESEYIQQIIDDLFHKMFELDSICTMCREKLKSFHEYYTFVLDNQKAYKEQLSSTPIVNSEFVLFVKEEPTIDTKVEEEVVFYNDDSEYESNNDSKKKPKTKRRVRKPHSFMMAVQKQQSDLIETLFDFKCCICTDEPDMSSFRSVVNHYKRVHKKTRMWTCCGKEMSTCVDLIEHVLEHKGGEWKCEPCSESFRGPIELWKHRYELHLEASKVDLQDPVDWLKLRFICDLCNEKFRTRGLIERHMKDAHTTNFTCDICGAGFYNRQASAKHRLEKHSDTHKIACPICKVMLRNTGHALRYHIKNLHKSKSMVCPVCGKICTNDSRYRMHMTRNHQPPRYTCSFCPKKFRIKYHCDDHEAIHTGVSRYFCDFCSAQFKSQGNFTAHKRKLHPLEHKKQQMERQAKRYQM